MSCTIVVRRARAADDAARVSLLRASVVQYTRDAFLMFFFQELTLQLSVLCGAVLFIFCGVSVAACCALVPLAAALLVAVSVYVTHAVLADKQVVGMRNEEFGYVAELSGPLVLEPQRARPRVLLADPPDQSPQHSRQHTQLVGTVSVSAVRGAGRAGGGWLHALAVHEQWRRRGVGRALVAAARRQGALVATVSALQAGAARLLRAGGWEVRGSYHRPLLGSALTLPMLVLGVEPGTLA